MKRIKRFLAIAVLVILALSLVACGGGQQAGGDSAEGDSEPTSSEEKIVIRLAHENDPTDHFGQGALHFAELVNQKTNGKVQIEVFDRAQLGNALDNIKQMQTDSLEMALVSSDLGMLDPFYSVLDLPYLFRDRAHVKEVFTGPVTEKLEEKIEGHGLVIVGYWENGFRQITNNKRPIIVPEDLKGLKIRVPDNAVRMEMFKQYGANPLAVSFAELYTSLQQGVVNAQENPHGNAWGNKFYEVQKYISESNHVYNPIYVLMAKPYWDKLTPDVQQAITEAALETMDWQVDFILEQEAKWVQDMVDYGCEVNQVNQAAFVEASKPVWDKFIKELGPEAQEVLDQILNTK